MYLSLLSLLPLSDDWIDSLPKVDMKVIVPIPGLEYPICADKYLGTPEETPTNEEEP